MAVCQWQPPEHNEKRCLLQEQTARRLQGRGVATAVSAGPAALMGCSRKGELLGLRWRDSDLAQCGDVQRLAR